jgi:hypothetical protein
MENQFTVIIVGGTPRHGFEPAVDGDRALAAFADGLAMFLQFCAMEILSDGSMRRRLARENEFAAGIVDGGDDRLTGKQIVTEIDRAKAGDCGAVASQPALRGIALAILLLRPVLRFDELRRQRQDPLVAWRDHAGTEEGVEVFGAAIGAPPRRTPLAFDLARAEVLSPVQRDQRTAVQALKRRQRPSRLDAFMNSPSNAVGEAPSSISRM